MRWRVAAPPALAAALAVIGILAGWRGTDLPAQLYRVTMFHRTGMALWDPQWFGGHWALAYSVLYPPVAATLGVALTSVLSAAAAALAFDRLVTGRFGRAAVAGSLLFAIGTTQQLAIGQLSFLMGRRWPSARAGRRSGAGGPWRRSSPWAPPWPVPWPARSSPSPGSRW